jgi:Rad/Gem-related GTP binding protein 1
VSVLLAGEESELTFIDFATADLSVSRQKDITFQNDFFNFQPDSCINKYTDPNAYCVVYSSADRSSLACAEKILQTLWTLDTISTKAVILVANKADLVRSKVVSTEGQ